MKRLSVSIVAALLLFAVAIGADKFDLKALEGQWEGSGSIAFAASPVSMDIDGIASFEWDTSCVCLRTALSAEKFMLKYSDTGKLYRDLHSDVVTWQVWDNYGRSRKYMGRIDGDKMIGKARIFKGLYDVTVRAPHRDTIDVEFYYTDPDSVREKTGYFRLWRKK